MPDDEIPAATEPADHAENNVERLRVVRTFGVKSSPNDVLMFIGLETGCCMVALTVDGLARLGRQLVNDAALLAAAPTGAAN